MNQNPISPKVTWAAVVGAAVTLVTAVLEAVGVPVDAAVQGAATTLLMALVGWLVADPLRQPPQ